MSLLKRFGKRLAAVSVIAASACAIAPAAEPRAATPAMWKVADHDTTIYLFGTIHLLPKNTKWRSPAFDQVVASADTLVLENNMDATNPAPLRDALRQLAMTPGLPPIVERVKPEKRAQLLESIRLSGLPVELFNQLETWAGGFLLLAAQLGRLGLDPGVESAIKVQFTGSGKSIAQLESVTEQLGFLDRMPEAAQRSFLEDALEPASQTTAQLQDMVSSWSRGDVKSIADSFNRDLKDSPDLKSALLVQRNANWAKWVKGRLDQPGTVLVAVGAGHLAGDESVQSMLEHQGVKVTRVQ